MFEIELISLLNKYNSCETDFDKNNIKNSIKKLIKENLEDFEKFDNKGEISNEFNELLSTIKEEISNESKLKDSSSTSSVDSDLVKIKEAFMTWQSYFVNNNRVPNNNCEQIIGEMIMFYAPNRFFVLKKVLEINDSNDFESFKNMLKNYIRKYYSEKIGGKIESAEFEELGFFEKRRMKKKILEVLRELGNYEFNEKKIKEVLG